MRSGAAGRFSHCPPTSRLSPSPLPSSHLPSSHLPPRPLPPPFESGLYLKPIRPDRTIYQGTHTAQNGARNEILSRSSSPPRLGRGGHGGVESSRERSHPLRTNPQQRRTAGQGRASLRHWPAARAAASRPRVRCRGRLGQVESRPEEEAGRDAQAGTGHSHCGRGQIWPQRWRGAAQEEVLEGRRCERS